MKLLSLLVLFIASNGMLHAGTPLVDRIGISVTAAPRQFAYTNKQAGTYYGEVNCSKLRRMAGLVRQCAKDSQRLFF